MDEAQIKIAVLQAQVIVLETRNKAIANWPFNSHFQVEQKANQAHIALLKAVISNMLMLFQAGNAGM